MEQPKAFKLSQLDPRRTYRPDQLPNDLDLNQLKVLEAKKIKNGKSVKVNPQRIIVGKPGEMVQVDLMIDTQNPKQTKG